jgi:hypothetical protein
MIAWINGAFGAGKTTAAAHLLEAVHDAPDMPEARLFDPCYASSYPCRPATSRTSACGGR